MMKILKYTFLISLFLLCATNLLAQQYELTISGYVGDGGDNCGSSRGLRDIIVIYQNGNEYNFLSGTHLENRNYNYSIKYNESNKIVRVNLKTAWRRDTSIDCRTYNRTDDNVYITSGCMEESYDTDPNDAHRQVKATGIVSVRPIVDLERPNPLESIAGYENTLTVIATEGFISDVYKWQYRVENGAWVDISRMGPLQFPHILSFNPRNFLPLSVIGKRVHFRTLTCEGKPSENVIWYDIRRSAPLIINHEITRVSCYDSQDGKIKLTLNRELELGDNLNISIVDLSKPLSGVDDYGRPKYDVIKSFNDISLDNSNSIMLDGLPPSTEGFRIDFLGGYNGVNYYTGDANHTMNFEIIRPNPVKFKVERVRNVWCNNGDLIANNDGQIQISASGGGSTGEFQCSVTGGDLTGEWVPFSNWGTHFIKDLYPGDYEIKVRKKIQENENYCVAREQITVAGVIELGNEITLEETVSQPDETLQITYENYVEPAAFGFTNGSITARISGGTIFEDNTYTYDWRNSDGVQLNSITTQFVAGQGYFITLNNIPSGVYKLTVRDRNYISSDIKTGCTIIDSEYELKQPLALNLTIDETHYISCNDANVYGDAFSDGELTAIASGGVQLDVLDNRGLPYYYTWKKKDVNGNWQILSGETDSKLSNISKGEYAVNIEDKNGIVVGTYTNNTLDIKTDVEHSITQPILLELTHEKTNVFCFGGNDGAIDLTVHGGTPPFKYSWSNGSETQDLSNLTFDTYTVTVTDSRGCKAIESIEITQPEELVASAFIFEQPTGFGLTNGWVETTIKGGTKFTDGTYAFEWRNEEGDLLNDQVKQTVDNVNNEFIVRLENIGEGKYNLVVTDANYNLATNKEGCGITNLEFTLNEPSLLELTIEESVHISCNQTNEYGNPSADGELIAHAKGGVLFNPGLPYIYTWKRKNENTGLWDVLTNQTDSIARNLNAGQYAVNIEDKNGIVIGTYVNNVLSVKNDIEYKLEEPDLLQISFNKRDVFCYDGSDGWAEVIIEGGTPPYKVIWNNGDETIRTTQLSANKYEVIVTDDRGCEVFGEIDIREPIIPINIVYNAYGRPTSIGASDAWIEADITGGTPFDDDTYEYEWVDESGNLLNSQTIASVVSNEGLTNYHIRLNNIVAGTYYLTVRDKNYAVADTKDGCTVISSDFVIYEPIEATIEIQIPISCNQNNEFLDPYSDGELIVHVKGGVPFLTGLPYNYYWKKQDENGVWQILSGQDTNIASNLSNGNYALNVEDSLGNIIGIYEGDLLVQETDVVFNFEEPELLQLEVTSTPISCSAGNDGTATVLISGGISDYQIEWSNGETTPTISNLIAGTYFVFVTDSRGCKVTSQIEINQPGNINIEIEKVNPICYEGSNGSIEINVTGGTSPYKYLWNTGETTSTINNLSSGLYRLQVIDAEGCNVFVEVLLEDPLPVPINLGENRTICQDQNLFFDIGIEDDGASYLWESDNGFTSTSSNVELFQSGLYKATITTSDGCIGYDEVEVTVSNEPIDAHFVLSTQAFAKEEILLVNISEPIGDKVEWTLPEGVNLVYDTKEKIIITFDEAGIYDINLRSFQGDCYADFSKKIIVEEATELPVIGDANNPFIEDFLVYPNPSDGNFKVKLSLSEEAIISVKVISLMTSEVMTSKREGLAKEFLLDYNLEYLPPGTYLLLLETPKGDEIRKLIFN